MAAVIVTMACSDGMSDRAYEPDITVIFDGCGPTQMLTACWSIALRQAVVTLPTPKPSGFRADCFGLMVR